MIDKITISKINTNISENTQRHNYTGCLTVRPEKNFFAI